MFALAVGVIGRISVGKSTIAKALSERTGIPFTSFGAYLVKYSKSAGLPIDRKALQDLGEEFINKSPGQFLENVINDVSASPGKIIVEGIRHAVILNEIKTVSKKAFLVYIDATVETRFRRYADRKKENDITLSFEDFIEKDSHVVESEIESLQASCDLIINSDQLNIAQTIEQIISYMT